MRKSIFSLCVLGASISASAQLSQTTTQWALLLDAAAPDMGIAFTKSYESLYYLSCTGTTVGAGESGIPKEYTDPTASIYYDGEIIATGAPYEGDGFNNNLSLVKTDLQGRFLWAVYSSSGDIASNNGGVVALPDGSVMLSVVIRHTDNLRTQPLCFVDATGQETIVDWRLANEEDKRWYQGLLIKVSQEGVIEWTKLINVSHAPVAAATGEHADHTSAAFYLSGMASDASGHVYVAGRYVVPITIDGNTLTPHNTEGWNGDSQQTRGDMFIAKFDAQGNLVRTLTTTGVACAEGNASLTMAQGKLWLAMTAMGTSDGSCAIALDGHQVALLSNQQCVVIACLDTDLHVQWLHQWQGEPVQSRDAVVQSARLTVAGNDLWLTGQFNGSFTDGLHTVASTTGNVREGVVVKCDAATGEWLAATTSKTAFPTMKNGIQGYLGAFEDASGSHVCIYGYTFGGESVTLMRLDTSTLAGEEMVTLIGGGSMPTAQKCIATGNTLYTLSRGRDSHMPMYELQPIGSDLSLATQDWAVCMAAFTLPFRVMDETPPMRGDVNGDGLVDVGDMNVLINIILHKDDADHYGNRAMVNDDNVVGIADVNALINIILHKE